MEIFHYLELTQLGDEEATLYLIDKFNPLLRKYARKLAYEDAYYDLLTDYITLQNVLAGKRRLASARICQSKFFGKKEKARFDFHQNELFDFPMVEISGIEPLTS